MTLTVTENKRQLIDIICKNLIEKTKQLSWNPNKLIITGENPTPIEVHLGHDYPRDDLKTTHEEADVIIPHQVIDAAENGSKCIKVICDDTDVFALLIHYFKASSVKCSVLMENTKGERSIIDIGETAEKHQDIVPSLLAAHALSGCDTVAYHYGIGKATVLKALQSGCELNHLGKHNASMDQVVEESTAFISKCYGYKNESNASLSTIRCEAWLAKTANGILQQRLN